MNINAVKQAIAKENKIELPTLMMQQQINEAKEPQPWVSHWENGARIRVTMHMDAFNQLLADKERQDLAYKSQMEEATDTRAEYTRYIVFIPSAVLATL